MTNIDERLAAFSARFAEQAGETAAAIEDSLAREAWTELAGHSHSLAGRAGMFGYGAIGEAARRIEAAIGDGRPHAEIAALTSGLLTELEAVRPAQCG